VLDYLTAALDIIYPRTCGGCDGPGSTICPDCLDAFVPVDAGIACPLCGRPVGAPLLCGTCISMKRHFSAGHFGFLFSHRLRDALLAFKFRGRKDVGRFLVGLLRDKLMALSPRFDVIVPLPVTEGRLRERGFNQTYVLSKEIARITGKPIDHRSLLKTRETKDQYTLSRDERRKNPLGAFQVVRSEAIQDRRVLLVDDLFTTGSTLSEASKTLVRAGAGGVEVFALARTP
jgi:ComF family protein